MNTHQVAVHVKQEMDSLDEELTHTNTQIDKDKQLKQGGRLNVEGAAEPIDQEHYA